MKKYCSVTDHYDALVRENDDPARDAPHLREYMNRWDGEPFLRALALSSTESVLEIGVGTGRLALRAAPLCGRFTGIDLSSEAIARAKENLAAFRPRLICADFLHFPFRETFDVIYSSLTFFHIRNKKRAIKKAFGLLNPGGKFVLSVEKQQRRRLVCGDRTLKLYPDDREKTSKRLLRAGFCLHEVFETPFAVVFAAERPT